MNLGVKRTNVSQATTVHTNTLSEDATANDLLGDRLVSSTELVESNLFELASFNLGNDCFLDACLDLVVSVLTLDLVCDEVYLLEVSKSEFAHCCVKLVRVRQEYGVVLNFLSCLTCELNLSLDQRGEERLGCFQTLRDDCLVGLDATSLDEVPATFGSFCLNHHDGDVFLAILVNHDATSNDEVKDCVLELLNVGECNPLAVNQGHTDTTDRTREWQTGDLG